MPGLQGTRIDQDQTRPVPRVYGARPARDPVGRKPRALLIHGTVAVGVGANAVAPPGPRPMQPHDQPGTDPTGRVRCGYPLGRVVAGYPSRQALRSAPAIAKTDLILELRSIS